MQQSSARGTVSTHSCIYLGGVHSTIASRPEDVCVDDLEFIELNGPAAQEAPAPTGKGVSCRGAQEATAAASLPACRGQGTPAHHTIG